MNRPCLHQMQVDFTFIVIDRIITLYTVFKDRTLKIEIPNIKKYKKKTTVFILQTFQQLSLT